MSSWHNQTHNLEKGINEKPNKIRKRGCSSSSSSSLVRRYRFKRAILVGKKGRSSTPVPMWNTRTKSPSMATHQHAQLTKPLPSSLVSCKEKELSMSARKLAATLWEINDLPPSRAKKDLEPEKMRSKKEIRSRQKAVRLSRTGLLGSHTSDPSYSPISERMNGFEGEDCKRRASAVSHKLKSADYYSGGFDALISANFVEVGDQPRNNTCCIGTVGAKNRLKEARSGLSTSKKLLRALNQICLQEQHSSSIPLVLALRSELDRVCNKIDQLIEEQSSKQNDMEHLMKHFAEEKAAWRRREREKVRDALTHIARELEVEKKLRRQTERLNKKIAKEMADVKASHLRTSKALETEKRAKEILEQICDELARGIGEDRAQVEELKRESAKVRDEVEKEREMLQLADVLREERVQMKLSEAKYQFEEKNAVLEKLRNELEAFFSNKEENGDISPVFKKIKDLESYLNKSCWGFQYAEKEDDVDVGEQGGEDSADSDLHSIELNMDNDNRSYKWSYACENDARDDSKRISFDSIGRKSFSEKIQWGSICFNKGTANCKRDFGINIQENYDRFNQEGSSGLLSRAQMVDKKDEIESYRSLVGLQESMSCASASANPPQRCGQPAPLQDTGGEAGRDSLLLEGDQLKQEATGRLSGG